MDGDGQVSKFEYLAKMLVFTQLVNKQEIKVNTQKQEVYNPQGFSLLSPLSKSWINNRSHYFAGF